MLLDSTMSPAISFHAHKAQKGHNDYVDHDHYDRVATVLLYLDNTKSGGETVFPYLESAGGGGYKWNGQTDYRTMQCATWDSACDKSSFDYRGNGLAFCCCKELLRVKPRRGDAVVFFPGTMQGTRDSMAAHAACPVRKGVKHVVQQWFHATQLPENSRLDTSAVQALMKTASPKTEL
mmetsp:Transcript_26751/g.58001  ORF Transcript_26751/g.58001 Transcript_26751/m.58001 type:complete len:178 (+) Transcript_26751:287-820(+)